MASSATGLWEKRLREVELLLSVQSSHAGLEAFAVGRAALVMLSAALAAYIEQLCREVADRLKWEEVDIRALDKAVEEKDAATLTEGALFRFHNPNAEKTAELFFNVHGLTGFWDGVTIQGYDTLQVQAYVNAEQQLRHQIVHGKGGPDYDSRRVARSVDTHREIVAAIDGRVETWVAARE